MTLIDKKKQKETNKSMVQLAAVIFFSIPRIIESISVCRTRKAPINLHFLLGFIKGLWQRFFSRISYVPPAICSLGTLEIRSTTPLGIPFKVFPRNLLAIPPWILPVFFFSVVLHQFFHEPPWNSSIQNFQQLLL